MSQVKWIKITTSLFDDEKIKIIEGMPERDNIIVIWLKLLIQAGKTNDGGNVYLSEAIPLAPDMLSILFNRPQETVEKALNLFKRFGMIEIDEHEFINVTNWGKHQNVDALEKRREADRERVRRHRERQTSKRYSNVTRNANVTDKEVDIDNKEIDKEKDIKDSPAKPDNPPYDEIVEYLNALCGTQFKHTSKKNQELIRARFNEGFGLDDFKMVIDNKFKDWANDEEMSQYLRPITLFGTKFESYLNQRPRGEDGGGKNAGKRIMGRNRENTGDYNQFIIE
jgi:predicted phage replisome organizer/uncharacterized phage protein (TIGR02220 family)